MITDMTDLLDDRRQHNAEIIGLLRDIRDVSYSMQAHSEEHEFIRELIEREKADKELRKAIKTKIITSTVLTGLGAVFAGLLLLLKDHLH